MAKQRVKKTTKKPPQSPANNLLYVSDPEELSERKKKKILPWTRKLNVKYIAAIIRAIRDVETERLLNALMCLIRSNFSKEQLQTPWNEKGLADGGGNNETHMLDFYTELKTSFLDAKNLQIRNFDLEEPSQMLGLQEGLQTPGVVGVRSQRMSVGMTPKTIRLPKQGEMLLSARGSPLGVYKEEQEDHNMEAIHVTIASNTPEFPEMVAGVSQN